jgi:hypothetical protein
LSVLSQNASESSLFDLALSPNAVPTPRPTTPTPATTRPNVRRLAPDELASTPSVSPAGAVAVCAGASSSGGMVTTTLALSPSTLAVVCHGFFPGAVTSMTCDPGSTGMAVPQSARPTAVPSRLISSPAITAASADVMVSFDRRGASAPARSRATFSRSDWPIDFAADAASRKPAHALAVCPIFS